MVEGVWIWKKNLKTSQAQKGNWFSVKVQSTIASSMPSNISLTEWRKVLYLPAIKIPLACIFSPSLVEVEKLVLKSSSGLPFCSALISLMYLSCYLSNQFCTLFPLSPSRFISIPIYLFPGEISLKKAESSQPFYPHEGWERGNLTYSNNDCVSFKWFDWRRQVEQM